MKKQSGFTLIELAIVLVIIGLLLGGVLKGQELINSARVKNLASDFRNTQVYVYGYQDRFRVIPGDDRGAGPRFASPAQVASNGTQNGVIEGSWFEPANTAESCVFWQHVRLAGFAAGKSAIADINCSNGNEYMPRNAEGGVVGIQGVTDFNSTLALTGANAMIGSFVVCSALIRGSLAKQLDTLLDDGDTAAGSVRVYRSGSSTWATTLSITGPEDSAQYNVCMAF
ncbi:MAG TPA: prepilin-type N-terminal cleavage/methylation domain-containing protein [Methylophilaceae bacterium]|nr:prepilin-type N-terminal cleavage/methylation domain-containing protein [Methylophilaceae bacterium]